MSEYADKLRSVGFLRRKGRSNTTPVLRDDGQVGGTRTEHWDDRVDATARNFDVIVNPNLVAARRPLPDKEPHG